MFLYLYIYMYNCMFVSALPDPTCNSEKSANGGNKQILLLLLLLLTELAGLHYQLYLVALCFLGVKNMLKGMVDTCASPHIYKVVDSIVHALTSPYPKSHYVVGWDAKLLWIWVSRLPAAIGDAILNSLGEKAEPSKCARANMPGDQTTRKINENNNAMNGSVLHN